MLTLIKELINKRYTEFDVAVFKSRYEIDKNAVLIDVSSSKEFAMGSIDGAINIYINSLSFDEKINALSKDKAYYVFCRNGRRSPRACRLMVEKGLVVYRLKGGFSAWNQSA